ncbi:hypothetical protein [Tenacibaculum halocynthiae]|uniref:hypothetical protein n=1 Tax=Tenacibaculum halocynthiae TaxID=1254437 RepID=UPI003894E242
MANGAATPGHYGDFIPLPFIAKGLGWFGKKLLGFATKQVQNLMIRYAFRITNPHLTSQIVKTSLGRFDYSKPVYSMLRRAPKGGIRIGGKKYLGGLILPFPRVYYGRGATFIPKTVFGSGMKPWPQVYLPGKFNRWATGVGLSGLGFMYYYQKTMKKVKK